MNTHTLSSSPLLDALLDKLHHAPETVMLDEALTAIAEAYEFTPVAFSNGPLHNAAGDKVRSCMLYAFGRRHGLTVPQMLACFGEHYREVLSDPDGTSHMTIRVFMQGGWAGVHHTREPLTARAQRLP